MAHVEPSKQQQTDIVRVCSECSLDYSFVLLNRDSYTQNEKFEKKKCEFNSELFRHGARIFISLEDLQSRKGFSDSKKDFLLELTLRSPKTEFQTHLRMRSLSETEPDFCRYDSEKFRFGDSEWILVFCPNMESEYQQKHLLQLQAIGRPEAMCKLKYRLLVGQRKPFCSPIVEEIIDFSGQSQGIYMSENYIRFSEDGYLPVKLELVEISHVSLVKLNFNKVTRGNSMKSNGTVCQDKDKQVWILIPSPTGELLTLSIHYSDVLNIPAGYLRFVQWKCSLVPLDKFSGSVKPIQAEESLFHGYYSPETGKDRGLKIRFPIKMSEIRDPDFPWIDPTDGRVTVEISWTDSHLLIHPTYTTHDDTVRRHNMQMRREIEALQRENNLLEKEVHNYQISISTKCSSGPGSHSGSPQHSSSLHSTSHNSISRKSSENIQPSGSLRSGDHPALQGISGNTSRVAPRNVTEQRRRDERYPPEIVPERVAVRSRSVEPPEEWNGVDHRGRFGRHSFREGERTEVGNRRPGRNNYNYLPPSSFISDRHHSHAY